MAGFNWKNYIQIHGDGPLADQIRRSLDEMASTPEGQRLIRDAYDATNVDGNPTGKYNLVVTDQDLSNYGGAVAGTYGMAMQNNGGIYMYEDMQGGMHHMTLQRTLFHEMYHSAHGHRQTPANERDAITATNDYMEKYYGETPRKPTSFGSTEGTGRWEFNNNFNGSRRAMFLNTDPETARQQIQTADISEIGSYPPELQALYETRDFRDIFSENFETLQQASAVMDSGFLEQLDAFLDRLTEPGADGPTQVSQAKPDNTYTHTM